MPSFEMYVLSGSKVARCMCDKVPFFKAPYATFAYIVLTEIDPKTSRMSLIDIQLKIDIFHLL